MLAAVHLVNTVSLKRHVDDAFDVAPIEGADRRRDRAAELLSGTLRPEANGAARRVAAERRALRAAQHFDAVEIDELADQRARGIDLPNAVDVGADVRNAAHAEARALRARAAAARYDDVRNCLAQLPRAYRRRESRGSSPVTATIEIGTS